MLNQICNLYAYLFARKIFRKLNLLLYLFSLRGLGVLNYENAYLIGENYWLKKYLIGKNKPVIIDVGANVGDYSSTVLACNVSSRILAFEPHPKNYLKLTERINSENFSAYNFAVGNENGTLNLYDYKSQDGSKHASIFRKVISDLHKSKSSTHKVEIIALGEFLEKKGVQKIDLLKIDVEGNEFDVLVGIKDYILNNQISAIHFEFNEMNVISRKSFKDFWEFLPNYNIYRLLPGGQLLHIKEYSPIFCEIYAFQNIVAILKNK